MRLRLELRNNNREIIMFRDYAIDTDGNAPKRLTDEVQEMIDVLRDASYQTYKIKDTNKKND
jgi:hypothetical protein